MRGFTTEAQSGVAFDRAHAEVRNQIVLVLVVVLVLEVRWQQSSGALPRDISSFL